MRNAVEVRKGCATMIQSHRARVDGDLGKWLTTYAVVETHKLEQTRRY